MGLNTGSARIIWPQGYTREHWLADMVNNRGYRVGAELGLWKGRTFFHLLEHCPNLQTLHGVDQWLKCPERAGDDGGQTYENWDMEGLRAYVTRRALSFPGRANVLVTNTVEAARIVAGPLDFVFIDADHREDPTRRDIELWGAKVRPGGLVSGHDWDWPSVRRAVESVFDPLAIKLGPDNVWWVDQIYEG